MDKEVMERGIYGLGGFLRLDFFFAKGSHSSVLPTPPGNSNVLPSSNNPHIVPVLYQWGEDL